MKSVRPPDLSPRLSEAARTGSHGNYNRVKLQEAFGALAEAGKRVQAAFAAFLPFVEEKGER